MSIVSFMTKSISSIYDHTTPRATGQVERNNCSIRAAIR